MKSPNKNKKHIQKTLQKKEKYKIFRRLYYLLAILVIFSILLIIRFVPHAAEIWMRYFYNNIQQLFAPLFSFVPFSLTEVLFLFLIVFFLTIVVLIIKDLIRGRLTKSLNKALSVLIVFSSVATCYFATAGIAYGRSALNLPQYQETVESENFVEIIEYFINDFNNCANNLTYDENGSVINPYTANEINDLLQKEFLKLDETYFAKATPNIKYLMSSFLYREFNIAGISFVPFFEANINYLVPDAQIMSTMAHEIAHTKGVMREQDANFVSAYILLNSNNTFLRYSGYFSTFYSLLELSRYVGDKNKYSFLYQSLNIQIKNDYSYVSNYWKSYNLLDDLATWFNDLYLKILGNQGVISYEDKPITDKEVNPDTGQVTLVIKEFSPLQKLYFYLYFS